jgi:hypothetical protein
MAAVAAVFSAVLSWSARWPEDLLRSSVPGIDASGMLPSPSPSTVAAMEHDRGQRPGRVIFTFGVTMSSMCGLYSDLVAGRQIEPASESWVPAGWFIRGQERLIHPLFDKGLASWPQMRGVEHLALPPRAGPAIESSPFPDPATDVWPHAARPHPGPESQARTHGRTRVRLRIPHRRVSSSGSGATRLPSGKWPRVAPRRSPLATGWLRRGWRQPIRSARDTMIPSGPRT